MQPLPTSSGTAASLPLAPNARSPYPALDGQCEVSKRRSANACVYYDLPGS